MIKSLSQASGLVLALFAMSTSGLCADATPAPTSKPGETASAPQYKLAKPQALTSAAGAVKGKLYAGMLFGDITGDGKVDLVATSVGGSLTLYSGTKKGFAAGKPMLLADGSVASVTNW